MDIKALTKILGDIKKISEKIIQKALPIMETIETEDASTVVNFLERVPGDTSHALEVLQDITLQWVKDAQPLKEEVEKFVLYEDESIRLNTEECKVLAEAWRGDAYDKQGIDGLLALKADLKQTLERISEEELMKEAEKVLLCEDAED